MTDQPPAERILHSGPFGTVEYAVRANGKMEAREWFEEQPLQRQAKFDHLFRSTVSHGKIRNPTQFRHLRGPVYEFKRDSDRLFCYLIEAAQSRWLLTHHLQKGGSPKCHR